MRSRSRVLRVAATVALGAAVHGCGSSGEDGRTVAGRSGSAAPSVVEDDVAALTSLRLVSTQAGDGPPTARVEAVLVAAGVRAAALRVPDGKREERLAADPTDPARFALAVDGAPADLAARFPAGSYAFVLEHQGGGQSAVVVLLEDGPWPDAPAVLGPPDGAVGVGTGPTVAWSAGPGAARFDVRVLADVAGGGAVVAEARDVLGTTHTFAPGTLAAGRAYVLEVAAADAPSTAGARREARTRTRFTTAAGGTP